jgi:WD40 repeat protein
VEIAHRDFDGEEMQHMLADVPEHLRRQPWSYLQSRLDTAVLTVEIADTSSFVASIPHPEQPNIFLTLQENGWVRAFDSVSGGFHDLFKVDAFEPTRVILAVSKDAQKIALVRHSPSGSHLEVRRLPGGEVLLKAESASRCSKVFFNPAASLLFCGIRTKNKVWTQSEVWNLNDGRKQEDLQGFLLWEDSGPTPGLYCVSKDNQIVEVDLSTGRALPVLPKVELQEVVRHINFSFGHVISSDAKVVFTVGGGQPLLRHISTITGSVKFESLLATGQVRGVDWNPSPPLVATLVQRSKQCAVLQLWQPESGALCKAVFMLGGEGESMLVVHKLSGRIAVFQGARVKVWNTREPTPLTTVEGLQATAPWFSFVPNSPHAVLTTSDGRLALSELSTSGTGPQPTLFLSNHPGIPSVSADGSTLLFSRKWGAPEGLTDAVQVFSRSGEIFSERTSFFQARFEGEGKRRLLSPNGSVFVSEEEGIPAFYETNSGKLIRAIKLEAKTTDFFGPNAIWLDAYRFVNVFDVRDDRPWAESTSKTDAIQIWDIRSGESMLKSFAPKVGLLCPAPDGRTLAEAGTDLRLRFRSTATLQVDREFRLHDSPIRCMAWHPTLPVLVTGADDSAVRVWDTLTGRLLHEFDGIQFPRQLFVSPDGRKLCVIRKLAAEAVVFELPDLVAAKPPGHQPSQQRSF